LSTETHHLVLLWRADKKGKLRAEPAMTYRTAEAAKGRAERAAEKFAGVVAISQEVDADTGEVGENPVVLFRAGKVPPEFGE
jgi:hypothetical protein